MVDAFVQGKFVLLPRDPINEYFYRFKNCLAYSISEELLEKLSFALDNHPTEDSKIQECSWGSTIDPLLDYH